jgi:hypothetical protein
MVELPRIQESLQSRRLRTGSGFVRGSTRTGAGSPPQCNNRLDGKRERQSKAANLSKVTVTEVWLPTR